MKTAKKGDVVVLSDGRREKSFVVLGFSKTHASLARLADYNHAMQKHGEYNRMAQGYTAWNLRDGAVQQGFWTLLKSVNGVECCVETV